MMAEQVHAATAYGSPVTGQAAATGSAARHNSQTVAALALPESTANSRVSATSAEFSFVLAARVGGGSTLSGLFHTEERGASSTLQRFVEEALLVGKSPLSAPVA